MSPDTTTSSNVAGKPAYKPRESCQRIQEDAKLANIE